MDATELLQGYPVVPVVVIDDVDVSVRLAKTLSDAGLNVIEVTLRTDDALAAIASIARSVPEMIVGAGSIRRAGQFREVKDAGAKFAVSPGASEALLDAAAELSMPFIPGAATPSEMIGLYERGYRLQKFFPAELAGGHAYLKSVGGPLPELQFMPTGGITSDNAHHYLALKNVLCIGGSWITPAELQKKGDFDAIHRLATDAACLGV
jgi:2-dehydro-3-deoxyphosphogluconate aldolase/(4S)-4-hydroxy-2-oxoglutarate aldolase